MTEKERDNLLLKIATKIDSIDEKVNKLDERMAALEERMTVLEERMTALEERVTALEERVTTLEEEMTALKEKVTKLDTKLEETYQEMRRISADVAHIEINHGSKIQALLDSQVGIIKNQDSFKKEFKSIKEILDNHASRIYFVESKVKNL